MTARSRAVCDVHHHSPPFAKGSLGASRAIAAESSRSASAALASVWGENGTPRFCALSTFRRSRAARSLSPPPEPPGVTGATGVAGTCVVSPSASSSTTAIRLGGAGVDSSDAANVTRLAGVEPSSGGDGGGGPCTEDSIEPSSGGNGGGRPCTEDSTPARYDSSTSPERIPSALRRAASLAALASSSKESTAAPTTSSSASRATASIAATAASCAAVVSSPAASLSVLSPTSSSSEEKSSDEVYRWSSSSPAAAVETFPAVVGDSDIVPRGASGAVTPPPPCNSRSAGEPLMASLGIATRGVDFFIPDDDDAVPLAGPGDGATPASLIALSNPARYASFALPFAGPPSRYSSDLSASFTDASTRPAPSVPLNTPTFAAPDASAAFAVARRLASKRPTRSRDSRDGGTPWLARPSWVRRDVAPAACARALRAAPAAAARTAAVLKSSAICDVADSIAAL
mmetsp:Transcript_12614/g.53251  ORF Transcript_12614/g.53251 Transcript_12614/m.53251 type:complete len:459 (+) Transcript_12614:3799-5175(+)